MITRISHVTSSRYRELSKQWHPDKNKDNTEKAQEMFVEIQKVKPGVVETLDIETFT